MADPNPYQAPARVERAVPIDAVPTAALPLRAMIAAMGSWVSLVLFQLTDPWIFRDGIWLELLTNALPWFILTPGLASYAMIVPASRPQARWTAGTALALFCSMPLSWRYVERLVTQLIPWVYGLPI